MDSTQALPRGQRPPRDPLTAELAGVGGVQARVVRLVTADLLLTVNPVDGSEVSPCPPEEERHPVRRTVEERAEQEDAAHPPHPPGPEAVEFPLLERREERERLVRLLTHGKSVQITGPAGSGRSTLLDAVADACADLAPDGVIRLSGYRRTPTDLLQDLFAAVHRSPGHRPDRRTVLALLREVGAVVIVDDLEFGGAGLEELLDAVPECVVLTSTTPEVDVPSSGSAVEELLLPGLTRVACLKLLECAVGRPLDEEEEAWAADLWFESEGLPMRFVQAGALLRQRDEMQEKNEGSVWNAVSPEDDPFDKAPVRRVPLPSLAESAAPAELLASRLGEAARKTLRFATALGGECPNQAHLPALVGDTHGDAALGEIVAHGLVSPVAGHYRLAAGVRQQLAAVPTDSEDDPSHVAAQHYAWWAGHPSVMPEQVAGEAEAIIAAMSGSRDGGHHSTAVLLARAAAPVFAVALYWSAWERALRIGLESARLAGEVSEEAYFQHELGVLALCTGNLDRARSELEASIGLRGALSDRQGTIVGRRTLALVVDRSGGHPPAASPAAVEIPAVSADASVSPMSAAFVDTDPTTTAIGMRPVVAPAPAPRSRGAVVAGSRRNLAAVGAGALLVAVLGTVVTIGAMADEGDTQNIPSRVSPADTTESDDSGEVLPADGMTTGSPDEPAPEDSGSATSSATQGTASASTDASTGTSTSTSTTADSSVSTSPETSETPEDEVSEDGAGLPSATETISDEPADPSSDPGDDEPNPTVEPTSSVTTSAGAPNSPTVSSMSAGASDASGTAEIL